MKKPIYFYIDHPTCRQNNQKATELADALWYLSVLAHTIGYSLKDIADMNIKKVTSRAKQKR